MFNLSVKVEYGILGVLALSLHAGRLPLSARTIARKEKLSVRFLEQAMTQLREKGIIESVRGPQGGYRLAREPQEIKLSDVILAMEGEGRRKDTPPASLSSSSGKKVVNEMVGSAETILENYFTKIAFDHLVRQVKIVDEEALTYHI